MARDSFRKVKLLKLLEMLQLNTDEQHPMTTSDILAGLLQMDIPCDRRTLAQDIATLNELDYEIMSTTVGHEKGYYVEDRNFSIPELKILIDAVHASSFITEKKSEELITKIASLAGSHRAEVLTRSMVCFNTRKHSNEKIFYNVDELEAAILHQKKILFRYFDLNEKGERVYRRDGHRYVVEPVALVFNEDNYYLTCYSSRHDSISKYRVDRMDSVQIIEDPCSEKAISLRNEVAAYTEQAFKMFGGQPEDVVLEFDRSIIGAVYDRFGENTQMIPSAENKCVASVKVQISPTFWGWLFQFAGQMQILSPAHLISEYKSRCEQITG